MEAVRQGGDREKGIGAEGYPKANSEAGSRQGGALPCTWSKAEARAPATPQASAAGAPKPRRAFRSDPWVPGQVVASADGRRGKRRGRTPET
ncbi:MAG: hypothetical protein ACLSHU_04750 [Oscillospiraceae bacterium]